MCRKIIFYDYIGGFYNNFSDAFAKDGKNILVKSKDNVKKMPNLKKLKKYIEKRMEIKNDFLKNIIILAEELKISIKIYKNSSKFISDGLNNFIDLIEKYSD